jgi:hypothetical protein
MRRQTSTERLGGTRINAPVWDWSSRVVRAALATIEREPLRYSLARGEVRRTLIRRFPYAVYVIADPDATVVIACLHVRRDPQVWHSRAGI